MATIAPVRRSVLARNLAALEVRHTDAVARLLAAPPRQVKFVPSRSGHQIPELPGGDVGPEALHSRYDPIREAHRLPQYARHSHGFFAFLGLGAGYHIREFLGRHTTTGAWIVEADAGLARAVMAQVDLTAILADPRTTLLVGEPVEAAASKLPDSYLPAVDGDLHTVNLTSLTRVCPDYFRHLIAELQRVMEQVAVDYTTQAAFGGRWFANILANLPRVEEASRMGSMRRPVSQRAIVVGAGPSAEAMADLLLAESAGNPTTVICCDTALPVLARAGIAPDYAVSVDCQHASYHHWMAPEAGGGDPITVLDVASPPVVVRRAERPVFFAGGHPMTQYLAQHWMSLPTLPTDGGNVGYAAVAFALSLGFESVELAGLDYAYPGKRYARGADVYTSMARRQGRHQPLEHQDVAAILKSAPIRQRQTDTTVYETRQLVRYRESLATLIAERPGVTAMTPWRAATPPNLSWRDTLQRLHDSLRSLPAPRLPLRRYLEELSPQDRDLVTIMLPAATSLHQRASSGCTAGSTHSSSTHYAESGEADDAFDAAELIERTRAWSLSLIERTIRSGGEA